MAGVGDRADGTVLAPLAGSANGTEVADLISVMILNAGFGLAILQRLEPKLRRRRK
jgi:hypothetical protein